MQHETAGTLDSLNAHGIRDADLGRKVRPNTSASEAGAPGERANQSLPQPRSMHGVQQRDEGTMGHALLTQRGRRRGTVARVGPWPNC